MLPIIDRLLLGNTALEFDETTYVQVIAGLGIPDLPKLSHRDASIRWSPNNFRRILASIGNHQRTQSLLKYRSKWIDVLSPSAKKVLLEEHEFGLESPDLLEVVKILNHPAANTESVIVEKHTPESDLRWQWPIRLAAFADDYASFKLTALRRTWPAKSLVEINPVSRESARCEALIISGSPREALRRILDLSHSVRASHILIFGPVDVKWCDTKSLINALFSETQAGALSLLSLSSSSIPTILLNEWVTHLSHNESYDLALTRTFPRSSSIHLMDPRMGDCAALPNVARALGQRLKRLPRDVRFQVSKSTPHRINSTWSSASGPSALGMDLDVRAEALPFDRESQGGAGLSEIAVAERKARRQASLTEPSRFLQGDLYTFSAKGEMPEHRGLVLGNEYRLEVLIGPLGKGTIVSDKPFDDDTLDWQKSDSFTLQVLFAEPRQWEEPLTGTLRLPRQGASSRCYFIFSPTMEGAFCGRVTVYYRGRILQTALLRTTVVKSDANLNAISRTTPLKFSVETVLRRSLSTLDDRRRFDACLVLNRTVVGESTAQVTGENGAYITSLDKVAQQLADINALLSDVALNDKRYKKGLQSDENAKLLCDLAASGYWIHNSLVAPYMQKSSSAESLRSSKYLQIVSMKPDAIIPLEFVYDYPQPKANAKVCEHAVQALKNGFCPSNCKPTQSPAPHVCPLGFWGLSKVIERHAINPTLSKEAWVTSEPVEGRNELTLDGPSLLAMSEEVPALDRKRLKSRIESFGRRDLAFVESWDAWRDAIAKKKPLVLVALPHAGGTGARISLEISGETLETIYINKSFVQGAPHLRPIVLLLGCDTVNAAFTDAYAQHIAVFRESEAALVLGTVATVLGKDAAKIAERLLTLLKDKAKTSRDRFGEVLLKTKQEAVAESLMIAMCLVAFGDADWRLK